MDNRKKILAALLCLLWVALAALPCFALTMGDQGEEVSRLQQVLYLLGYTQDEPDGVYGEKTRQAAGQMIKDLQSLGQKVSEDQLPEAFRQGLLARPLLSPEGGWEENFLVRCQRRLRALGYLADKADGQMGKNTQRALLIFQKENSLPLTGQPDEETCALLFSGQAVYAPHPILTKGMKGDQVLTLQQRLWQLGFFYGDMDGQYGKEVVEAVKALGSYIAQSGLFDYPQALLEGGQGGQADGLLLEALAGDFPLPLPMGEGSEGQDVYRLQRRLRALGYLMKPADGGYGADTLQGVKDFQKQAGLKAHGKADEETLALLFSGSAPEKIRPYQLTVSLSEGKIRVYSWEGKDYSRLRYTMDCTIGHEVQPGSYRETTRPDEEWKQREDGSWVAWCFRVEEGLFIHSAPYDAREGKVDTKALMAMGTKGKGPTIMVSPENARLIYEKCPPRTPISIEQ